MSGGSNRFIRNISPSLAKKIDGEWVVLKAGDIEIALHRAGQPNRGRPLGADNLN